MTARPVLLAIALTISAVGGAQAHGCLKGAVVGGVAGHMAHHHALLGAAAGCVIGHHIANKHERERREVPAPAPGGRH